MNQGQYITASSTGSNLATTAQLSYGLASVATGQTIHASGVVNTYGGFFSATGNTTGTNNAYGIYTTAASGDNNIAAWLDGTVIVDLGTTSDEAICGDDGDADVTDVTLRDCSSGVNTDYAEAYATAPDVEFGDIVMTGSRVVQIKALNSESNIATDGSTIDDIELIKSAVPYNDKVIGVAVDNYGDFSSIGHDRIFPEDHPMPVALNGRVPVKVSDEGGPIEVGDLLTTSSTPGHAMKGNPTKGTTFGKALTAFDGAGTGEILAFIQLDNRPNLQTAFADIDLQALSFTTSSNNTTIDTFGNINTNGQLSVNCQMSSVNCLSVANGAFSVDDLGNVTATGNITTTGQLQGQFLNITGDAQIDGTLKVSSIQSLESSDLQIKL